MEVESLAREMETAVRVVHLASSLCVKVQEKLRLPSSTNGNGGGHVKSKDDDSPVTVAGLNFYLLFIVMCFRDSFEFFWGGY